MELIIHNFKVKEICFGENDSYIDGVLTLNKERLISEVKKDEHILDVDIHLVKPGDNVRLYPVKDAIESRSRTYTFTVQLVLEQLRLKLQEWEALILKLSGN